VKRSLLVVSLFAALAIIVAVVLVARTSGQTTATPVFSQPGGTYNGTQTVAVTDATPGAQLHCTTDGSTPSTSSPLYLTYFNVPVTTTIECLAFASRGNSSVASATFNINIATATLTLSDSKLVIDGNRREGINIGCLNNYECLFYKNLARNSGNWDYEPVQFSQINALTAKGTNTTYQNTNPYFSLPVNAWAGATVQVREAQTSGNKGYSGTITANTAGLANGGPGAGATYTVSPAAPTPFAEGDIVVQRQYQFPTNFNHCGACINGSTSNGGTFATDTKTPYDGKQSLVYDVSAGPAATADSRFYFGDNTNLFALLTGTWRLGFWARSYSGGSTTIHAYLNVPEGSGPTCSLTATPTGKWAFYSTSCNFTQTYKTPPSNEWIQFSASGANGLGAVEVDDVDFEKTAPVDPTNTTVFRDEVVDALRQLCASGTPGPPCPIRFMFGVQSEEFKNRVQSPGAAYNSGGGSGWDNSVGAQQPRLQEELQLTALVNGIPYLQNDSMWTPEEGAAFVEYMSSTDPANKWVQLRKSQGQVNPWVGPNGVFPTVYATQCNECWNFSNAPGQVLPQRNSSPGGQIYYDQANDFKDIYAAMRADPAFSKNMRLCFNVQTGGTYSLDSALALMDSVNGAPDCMEVNGYEHFYASSFNTAANRWQAASMEPWADATSLSATSQIPSTIHYIQTQLTGCGPQSGSKPTGSCEATIYEMANSTQGTCGVGGQVACSSVANAAIDQANLDVLNAGAQQGLIAAWQSALDPAKMQIKAQVYFALGEYQNGSFINGLSSKLWGLTVDLGGSLSNLDHSFARWRPQGITLSMHNKAIIGPEYEAMFSGQPIYQWPGSNYNGSTAALANVPWIDAHYYVGTGNTRSLELFNMDIQHPYTVNVLGTSAPAGNCVTSQYAPSSPDLMNEAHTGLKTNTAPLNVPTPPYVSAPCTATITLPAGSLTTIAWSVGKSASSSPHAR
jgi:hypothetical protein